MNKIDVLQSLNENYLIFFECSIFKYFNEIHYSYAYLAQFQILQSLTTHMDTKVYVIFISVCTLQYSCFTTVIVPICENFSEFNSVFSSLEKCRLNDFKCIKIPNGTNIKHHTTTVSVRWSCLILNIIKKVEYRNGISCKIKVWD